MSPLLYQLSYVTFRLNSITSAPALRGVFTSKGDTL